MMTKKRSPIEEITRAKDAVRAEVEEINGRLARARALEREIYSELEAAVTRAAPVLGATEVQRLAGFKSRASVYQILDRTKEPTAT